MKIRRAVSSDLSAITAIYNQAVETTTATFDTEPKTLAEQAEWLEKHTDRFPVYVAEDGGAVVGWASLSPWSGRCAYRDTAETSFYVEAGHRGKGIGRLLKDTIIAEARALGYHVLIAQIADGADASRHINETAGFHHAGTLREVGKKFGRVLDVHLYQLILD